jgi:hypothetical protein
MTKRIYSAASRLLAMPSMIMSNTHNSLFQLQTPEQTNFTQSKDILIWPQKGCSNVTVLRTPCLSENVMNTNGNIVIRHVKTIFRLKKVQTEFDS